MTGLILKDFLGLRNVLKSYLIVLVIYVALTVFGVWSPAVTTAFFAMMAGMLPFTCFNMDHAAKWEPYGAALPVNRNKTVAARYLTLLIMLGAVAALELATAGVLWLTVSQEEALSALMASCVCLGMGAVLNAIILPLIYRFGAERARIIFYAAFLGLIGLAVLWLVPLGGAEWLMDALAWLEGRDMMGLLAVLPFLFVAVCLLLLIPSWFISCAIYKKSANEKSIGK